MSSNIEENDTTPLAHKCELFECKKQCSNFISANGSYEGKKMGS